MARTKKAFQDSLTLVSMVGFLVIALDSFDLFNLAPWQTGLFLMIAGAGLFIEGEGLTVKRWASNGIQGNEVQKLITIMVGIFSVVVGILSLPFINLTNPQVQTVTGFVSLFALIFIALERWVI